MTSDFDLPPIGHTMKEALALIDQLGPTAAPRYTYNKLRHLLSKLMGTKALFFREQPALQLVRGREVAIQMPGKYEMPPSGELLTSIQELGPREPRTSTLMGDVICQGHRFSMQPSMMRQSLQNFDPNREALSTFSTANPYPTRPSNR